MADCERSKWAAASVTVMGPIDAGNTTINTDFDLKEKYTIWSGLFAALFLFLSYFGCDQSQVQRQLSTRDIDATNNALLINGLLRFPLVLLYCFVGVGIGVYATSHPEFLTSLPVREGAPEYNLAVPMYMIQALPDSQAVLDVIAYLRAVQEESEAER